MNAEQLIENWARLKPVHPDYEDITRLIPNTCRQWVADRDSKRSANAKILTLRLDYDQCASEPEDASIATVSDSYGDLKNTSPAAYQKGWRVQMVPSVAGSQRRRDLWVAVNLMSTHGTTEVPSATVKELAKGIAQEWAHWADGDVVGYQLTDANGDEVDSCWGFYGEPYGDDEHYLWESIKDAIPEGAHIVKVTGNAAFDRTSDLPSSVPTQ